MRARTSATRLSYGHNGAAAVRERVPSAGARRASKPKRKPIPPAADGQFVLLPSFHSESTREVIMQSGPGKQADRMAIAYHTTHLAFELSARGTALLAGTLECELVIDGASHDVRGDWQAVCWYADDDGDYLELRCCVNDSVWIDRQMLLSRHSHLAMIADAVVARGAVRLEYRMRLPVTGEAVMKFDAATRECRLEAKG